MWLHLFNALEGAVDFAERYRGVFLGSLVALAIACLVSIPGIPIDDSPEAYLDKDDPALARQAEFERVFGGDRTIAVTVELGAGVMTPAGLSKVAELTDGFERLDNVVSVQSLSTVEWAFPDGAGMRVGPVAPGPHAREEAIAAAHLRIKNTPHLRGLLVSDDNDVTSLYLSLSPVRPATGSEDRARLLAEIRRVSDQAGVGEVTHLIGLDVLTETMRESTRRDVNTLIAGGVLLVVLVLSVLLREPVVVAVLMAAPLLALLLCLGLFRLTGTPLTMLTATLPMIVMVYTLGDALHVFFHLERHAQGAPSAGAAIARLLPACLFTTATTAIGFGSLGLSTIGPVADFGFFTASGVVIAFLIDLSVLPILLRMRRSTARRSKTGRADRVATAFAVGSGKVALRAGVGLIGVAVLVAGASGWGISHLRVDSNLMHTFSPESRLRRDLAFHDEHMSGALALEVVVQTEEVGAFRRPAIMRRLEEATAVAAGMKELTGAFSAADLVVAASRALADDARTVDGVPDDAGELAECLEIAYYTRGARRLDDFLDPEARVARLSVRSTFTDSLAAQATIEKLGAEVETILGEGFSAHVTGTAVTLAGSLNKIVLNFLRSFQTAVVLVFFILLGLTRSLRWSLIAMCANLAPIVAIYAVLGFWKGRFDFAAVLLASVAFGIAVDDTLHLLGALARAGARGYGARRATLYALRQAGAGIVTTSVVLTVAFSVGLASEYDVTAAFGLLLSVGMLAALVADLLLLPLLVRVVRPPPLTHFGLRVGDPFPLRSGVAEESEHPVGHERGHVGEREEPEQLTEGELA
jgi:predicted RND superfamily exporter protein